MNDVGSFRSYSLFCVSVILFLAELISWYLLEQRPGVTFLCWLCVNWVFRKYQSCLILW